MGCVVSSSKITETPGMSDSGQEKAKPKPTHKANKANDQTKMSTAESDVPGLLSMGATAGYDDGRPGKAAGNEGAPKLKSIDVSQPPYSPDDEDRRESPDEAESVNGIRISITDGITVVNGLAEPLPLAAELSTVGVPIPYERDEARELAIEKLQILGRVMDGGLTERLTGITQLVTKLLNVQFAAVTLVYKGAWIPLATYGLRIEGHIPCAETICDWSTRRSPDKEIFVVEDCSKDHRFKDKFIVTSALGLRFYVGAPIRNADGCQLGQLCAFGSEARTLNKAEAVILGNLAEMISRELERESLLARALGGEEATTLRQLRAFESLQESVLIIDTAKSSWPVVYCNPHAEAVLGHKGIGAEGFSLWSVLSAGGAGADLEKLWSTECANGNTFTRRVKAGFSKDKATGSLKALMPDHNAMFRPAKKAMDLTTSDLRRSPFSPPPTAAGAPLSLDFLPNRPSTSSFDLETPATLTPTPSITAGIGGHRPAWGDPNYFGNATKNESDAAAGRAGGAGGLPAPSPGRKSEAASRLYVVQLTKLEDETEGFSPLPEATKMRKLMRISENDPRAASESKSVSRGSTTVTSGFLGAVSSGGARSGALTASPELVTSKSFAMIFGGGGQKGTLPSECRGRPVEQSEVFACPLPSVRLLTRLPEGPFQGLWFGSMVAVHVTPMPRAALQIRDALILEKLQSLHSGLIGHPCVASFLEFAVGTDPTTHEPALWCVQELTDNETLDEALVSSAFLDPTDPLRSLRNLLTVFVDIVRGLRYLHAKKLAHGNLSSAAVFIHATAHATLGGTLAVRGILEENAAEMVPGDLMAVGKIVWDATRRIMSMYGAALDPTPMLKPSLFALQEVATGLMAGAKGLTDLRDVINRVRADLTDDRQDNALSSVADI